MLQVAARNLGLILRKLFGIGTPRTLQDLIGLCCALYLAMATCWGRWWAPRFVMTLRCHSPLLGLWRHSAADNMAGKSPNSTGC